jgi:translation initiation factor 3 subunit K
MGREAPKPQQQQQGQGTAYTVEQLVALNPYNPDILPDLENYVNDQVSLTQFHFSS